MGKNKGKSKNDSGNAKKAPVPEPPTPLLPQTTQDKPKPDPLPPPPQPSPAKPEVTLPAPPATSDSAKDVQKSAQNDSNGGGSEVISCSVCNLPAKSRCGGCQKVAYCSKEHQKAHWKQHKGECCPWKICENEELGRYLIAARDIKPGEIVIQEKPLLITPPKITPPVCLGCYSEFKPDGAETDDGRGVKPVACKNACGWPMCKSSTCHNSKDHESECRISQARGKVVIRHVDCEHPIYQTLGVLRVLGLQEKDSEAFDKLLSLVPNTEKRRELHKKMEEDGMQMPSGSGQKIPTEANVKLIQDFFKRPDVSEEWIVKLMGIIETNGHEIPIPDEDGHINRRLIGVYHIASFLEHDCRPNCVKSYELSKKEILIRSSVPIRKGDHLSISYVDPLWGTSDRVNLLRMTKFFTCTCKRCKDPAELGCHISSLRCQHLKCMKDGPGPTTPLPKHGMIIPLDPFKGESEWKCQTCGEDYNASYASSLVHKAGEELEELSTQKPGDIGAKEEYLKRFLKTLSSNHFYLLEVKLELAQLYGRTAEEPLHILAPKKLLRKIQLCEELLIVFEKIAPGYNRLRALVIYELQAAVFALSRLRRSVEEISMEKHLQELMQCGKWMTEVIKVLGWESHNSIERKRAAGAERDLQQLREAVLSLQTPSDEIQKIPKENKASQNNAKPPSPPPSKSTPPQAKEQGESAENNAKQSKAKAAPAPPSTPTQPQTKAHGENAEKKQNNAKEAPQSPAKAQTKSAEAKQNNAKAAPPSPTTPAPTPPAKAQAKSAEAKQNNAKAAPTTPTSPSKVAKGESANKDQPKQDKASANQGKKGSKSKDPPKEEKKPEKEVMVEEEEQRSHLTVDEESFIEEVF